MNIQYLHTSVGVKAACACALERNHVVVRSAGACRPCLGEMTTIRVCVYHSVQQARQATAECAARQARSTTTARAELL